MTPKLFTPAILAVVLTATGAAAAPVRPDAAAAARGATVARRNCVQCHAIDGAKTSPNPAAPRFRELYRRYPADALDEALMRGLLTRHPAMPGMWFAPQQLNDLAAYVKSLRGEGAI